MNSSRASICSKLEGLLRDVEQNPTGYNEQISALEALLADPELPARARATALRLMGVALNRARLYRDALASLGAARGIAINEQDYAELANVQREMAVVYAWRGDDKQASMELLHALAYANLEQDRASIARSIAELGRVEWEARRYASAARLLRHVVTTSATDLPRREAQRVKVTLCQALNRLGQHSEALEWVKWLKAELDPTERRLLFLTRLEEARALSGLGRAAAAGTALAAATPRDGSGEESFEQAEYQEAETELAAASGGPSVEESLEALAMSFDDQNLVVRSAEIRIRLARHLFATGETERARTNLCTALRNAVAEGNIELAERLRAEMIKSQEGRHIEELAEDVEEIAGGSSLNRRFILIKRLGQGGFGVVHQALDLRDGLEVALKRIALSSVSDRQRRSRLIASLRSEYGAANRLPVHPGIARVRDILIEPGGTLFIVQDFVNGTSLRELYRPIPQAERLLLLLAGIAESLAVLKAKGIAHRDLKPENVIVRDQTPVVIDFGIAYLDGSEDLLRRLGTSGYAAPEQTRGERSNWRADIYALGKMLSEIWGEERSGFSSFAKLWRKQKIPKRIRYILPLLLAENPEDRLDDFDAIAAALRQAQADLASRMQAPQ
jgi:hypothetical protein